MVKLADQFHQAFECMKVTIPVITEEPGQQVTPIAWQFLAICRAVEISKSSAGGYIPLCTGPTAQCLSQYRAR